MTDQGAIHTYEISVLLLLPLSKRYSDVSSFSVVTGIPYLPIPRKNQCNTKTDHRRARQPHKGFAEALASEVPSRKGMA
jgi:hypothetical protein